MWLVVANFLVLESFVLGAVGGGQVAMCLQTSNYCSRFCNFLSPEHVKCYTLKGRSLEHGLSWVFQDLGNILLQKAQSQHDSARGNTTQGLEPKEEIQYGVGLVLLCNKGSQRWQSY